jgi:hypothetical protein
MTCLVIMLIIHLQSTTLQPVRTVLTMFLWLILIVDAFLEAPITQKNQQRCSLVRRGRSAAQSRTVRDLARGGGALWSGADGPWHRAGRSATWCRG